jgi:hypothetical protein
MDLDRNDSLWNIATSKGFEVVVFDRNVANREKKVDTKIATDMIATKIRQCVRQERCYFT